MDDIKVLKEEIMLAIDERLTFLKKLESSTDLFAKMAYLIETQTIDLVVIKDFACFIDKTEKSPPAMVYKCFSEIYPSIKDKLLAGLK